MKKFIVVSILVLPLVVTLLVSKSVEARDLPPSEQNLDDDVDDGQNHQENVTESSSDPQLTRYKKSGKRRGALCKSQKGCRSGYTCVKSKCQKTVDNCPPAESPATPVIVTNCTAYPDGFPGSLFECMKIDDDQPEDSVLVTLVEGGPGDTATTDYLAFGYSFISMDCPTANQEYSSWFVGAVNKNDGPVAIRIKKTNAGKCPGFLMYGCLINGEESQKVDCTEALTVVPAEKITLPRTA